MSAGAASLRSPKALPGVRSRWPQFEPDEVAAVVDVLTSGRVNSLHHGEQCRALEAAFAARCSMPYAISMANGSVTLEVALRALGIGKGDEVIVTPRSFMASASCVVSVGAVPVFADVDADTQMITPATATAVLTPRTRAIIPVHLCGWPADMRGFQSLAARHELKLIEDCAQAHGATIDGLDVGGFGDAASFSFCTDKIMSTGGEGGLLLLRDPDVHGRAWSLKDHGKRLEPLQPPGAAFRWLHDSFGTNLRMTEMQAAIGLAQLRKLDGWLARRRANAAALDEALAQVRALRRPWPPVGVGHAWYRYTAFVRPECLREGESRDSILARAQAEGLPCFSGSCPEIYRERAFVDMGLQPPAALPAARQLGETSLVLAVDHTLTPDEVAATGTELARLIEAATR